jgi:hypothetical protein
MPLSAADGSRHPCGFLLGVVIKWGPLVKTIRIARWDVRLSQFLGTIDNGFERSVFPGELSEYQARRLAPGVRSEEAAEEGSRRW